MNKTTKENGDSYFFRKYLEAKYVKNKSNITEKLKKILDLSLDQTFEAKKDIVNEVYGNNGQEINDLEDLLSETGPVNETNTSHIDRSLRDDSLLNIMTKNLSLSYTTDSRMSTILTKSQRFSSIGLDNDKFHPGNKENSYTQKYLSKKKKNGLNFDMPLRKDNQILNESMHSLKINIKNL